VLESWLAEHVWTLVLVAQLSVLFALPTYAILAGL
jgi:hypothetical protein